MTETFQDFIARDRERLHAEREAVFTQQHELEGKLAAINNELRAIDAYEAAKSGKASARRPAPAGLRKLAAAAGVRASSVSSPTIPLASHAETSLKRWASRATRLARCPYRTPSPRSPRGTRCGGTEVNIWPREAPCGTTST